MTPLEIAEELVGLLTPGCNSNYIKIAGSLRRGRTNPKDIEIVCVPRLDITTDMFGNKVGTTSHLEAMIYTACLGNWAYDMKTKRNGPHYKRLRHVSGIACDLFITDEKRWGIIYTLRTGPGEFSQGLVTLAREQGRRVHEGLLHNHVFKRKMVQGADPHWVEIPCEKGEHCPLIIPTPEEIDFFTALGLRFLEPSQRTPEAITNS